MNPSFSYLFSFHFQLLFLDSETLHIVNVTPPYVSLFDHPTFWTFSSMCLAVLISMFHVQTCRVHNDTKNNRVLLCWARTILSQTKSMHCLSNIYVVLSCHTNRSLVYFKILTWSKLSLSTCGSIRHAHVKVLKPYSCMPNGTLVCHLHGKILKLCPCTTHIHKDASCAAPSDQPI